MHRALAVIGIVSAFAACSSKPQYQGDTVLGGFDFDAELVSDTCFDGGGGFQFSGVFSYDSCSQKLFLDTDNVTADDHVGTLEGGSTSDSRHFVLQGEADRDFSCGTVHVVEILEGDLYDNPPDGGCDAISDAGAPVETDGGAAPACDGGGIHDFQPLLACGAIRDDATQTFDPDSGAPLGVSGDGGGCGTCEIVYRLVGTRQ